jgi:hypothetical protein
MKLLRYGPKGHEKPGMLAADGSIRSLADYVDDIAGEALSENGLRKLAGLDPMSLPVVEGSRAWVRRCRASPSSSASG